LSLRELAKLVPCSHVRIHQIENGDAASPEMAARLDQVLGADGALTSHAGPVDGDELDAIELMRRVQASDVGGETLERLEAGFDDLASAYATDPPEQLLPRVRQYVGYVARLVDARKTLDQHRRLLVVGGWLSLLAATVHIDLRHGPAAAARLNTAAQLAEQAEHTEIQAWCLETRAWDLLTSGDFPAAVRLSQRAQRVAPRSSSAHVQATAQEGRAWARMGQQPQTRAALEAVARLADGLPRPDRPEHHYRYDPDKALSYTATTLAWAGDPAAEEYARTLIRHLESTAQVAPRPRRVALARLDLALALLAAGRHDEAHASALAAITSGRIVASNWWRVGEVLGGVERAGLDVGELREAARAFSASLNSR
jgi:tetratricopeptide (TPR) repeat protein